MCLMTNQQRAFKQRKNSVPETGFEQPPGPRIFFFKRDIEIKDLYVYMNGIEIYICARRDTFLTCTSHTHTHTLRRKQPNKHKHTHKRQTGREREGNGGKAMDTDNVQNTSVEKCR